MAMIGCVSQDYLALAPLAGWPEAAQTKRPLGALTGLATRFLAWRAQRETVRVLNAVDPQPCATSASPTSSRQVYGAPEGRKRGYDPDRWRRPTMRR